MTRQKLRVMAGGAAVAAALAIGACGGTEPGAPSPGQPPVTFATTLPTPTTDVAAPTRRAQLGPQGVLLQTGPFLASASSTLAAVPVHGILCQQLQQLAYRAFAHLQVYLHGHSRALPGGIGMVAPRASARPGGLIYTASTCYYWLHTRAADGLILVQSPSARSFTLGNFFAIWNQPLSRKRIAGLRGKVTARVNGKLWTGTLASIPLREHEDIELAVGRPVPATVRTDWVSAGI